MEWYLPVIWAVIIGFVVAALLVFLIFLLLGRK